MNRAARLALCASSAALFGCAPPARSSPGAPEAARALDPPVAGRVLWRYDVDAGRAGADDLSVVARFEARGPLDLSVDEDASRYVHGVEYGARAGDGGAAWAPLPDGPSYAVPCAAGECRVRYRFALHEAAESVGEVDTANAAGGMVVAPPSTWLLRPDRAGAERALFRFHVQAEPPTRFVAGTDLAPDGAADTYQALIAGVDRSSFAAFGAFHEETVVEGAARVVVAVAPRGLSLSPEDAVAWVRRAVNGVARYLGHFPAPRALVIVEPGRGGSTEGETLGDGGPSVLVRAGVGVDAARTRDDWVVTHELLHVSMPSLPFRQKWLEEGIATYVEPIVRARAGLVSDEKYWRDLVEGLPKGEPEAGDEGLDRTHTWGRTYWGGALFCFLADIELREASRGARSWDDVMRAVVATGEDVESHWDVARFIDVGDRATGMHVLRSLYEKMALSPETVDLAPIWGRLGVRSVDSRIQFDDAAPLAAIRLAITRAP